jgi:hypothetical protein
LSTTYLHRIDHPAKILQAGDGLNLAVSDSQTLGLRFRACGRSA